jgi:hypothetical protein
VPFAFTEADRPASEISLQMIPVFESLREFIPRYPLFARRERGLKSPERWQDKSRIERWAKIDFPGERLVDLIGPRKELQLLIRVSGFTRFDLSCSTPFIRSGF